MQKIVPCLWFNTEAKEAAEFYSSLFKSSKIELGAKYGNAAAAASGQPKGSLMTVRFWLAGQEFLALNGGPHFRFTPALSLMVSCDSLNEIDELWAELSKGGTTRMAFATYPFAQKYGWCEDRFGVNWQLIFNNPIAQKITPSLLFTRELSGKAEEAMQYYLSVFENAGVDFKSHDETGKYLLHGRFHICGQSFVAFEGPGDHEFGFNESMSFIVNCQDQIEIDRYWNALSANKAAEQCGWLKDKFGVSWQIVPSDMAIIMSDPDLERKERVMELVMKMKKIEVEPIKRAYKG